ncbi:hypothetical protein CQW23_10381 [Capsicum baccatum]|uniref:Uncharacterized protein n=1 Tax=Capsicum baccatum TaxID=33114 RepID=A0A2G2WZG8_CAPBA|nr:hypothetical protein CQW23_10381 [Capsicum baccatum]
MASSNVKTLKLHSQYHLPLVGYGSLEIFAPHLQHLHISGELIRLMCRLVNVSSLVTASLTFTISCITDSWYEDDIKKDRCPDYHQVLRNLVLDYLQKLSSVTELIIGTWLAEFGDLPCQLQQSYFDEVDNINLPSWIPISRVLRLWAA